MKKLIIFLSLIFLYTASIHSQCNCIVGYFLGTSYINDYCKKDVDALLAFKTANPQANLNWTTTSKNLQNWKGCTWELCPSGIWVLRKLDVSNYQLSALNISSFTNLNSLICSNNLITSLNVNSLVNLEYLDCSNNQLSSLHITNLLNLKKLLCSRNLLTSLITNNLANLELLSCSNNQLSILNASGCVNLKDLECDSNQLTSLIVNNLTNLEGLYCVNNQLHILNLKGCVSLWEIQCIDNKIDSLDISDCKNLFYLGCCNNQLSDKDLINLYGLGILPLTVPSMDNLDNYIDFLDLRKNIGFTEHAIRALAENLPNINYEQILWDSIPHFTAKMYEPGDSPFLDFLQPYNGIAADGEAKLTLRLLRAKENNPLKRVNKIGIVLKNEAGDTDPSIIGHMGMGLTSIVDENPINGTLDDKKIEFYGYTYYAPKKFNTHPSDNNKSSRTVNTEFRIELMDGSIIECCLPIEIIRPPVLLIHGLNSGPIIFDKLENKLLSIYKEFQIRKANYESTNKNSFESNKTIVKNEIDLLTMQMYEFGYSAKKVDIVGHSMGGLLTRQYLQSSSYINNIYRLITLNTPHSGSQLANLFLDGLQAELFSALFAMNMPGAWSVLTDNNVNLIKRLAISDLCVNSFAIKKLNGIDLNKNIVPSHAIYTSTDYFNKRITFLEALSIVGWYKSAFPSVQIFLLAIYDGEYNDIVVPISSQKGGLSAISHISNQRHSSTENDDVIEKIKELLTTETDEFSLNGFNPPTLTWNNIFKKEIEGKTDENEITLNIGIISKTECTGNEEIKIPIAGSENITGIQLLVEENSGLIYNEYREGNNIEFTYVIPENALGIRKILAIGYSNNGNTAIDTAHIHASTDASLIYIEILTDRMVLFDTLPQTFHVYGLFSDGIYREVTFESEIQYLIKHNKAKFEEPNVLRGQKLGYDTLLIAYNGKEIILPLYVMIDSVGNEISVSSLSKEFSQQNILHCYPNPFKNEIKVSFTLKQATSATLFVYNIDGKVIKKVEIFNSLKFNERNIDLSSHPYGMYFIVLETNQKVYVSKIIKER